MTGHNWTGAVMDWTRAPEQYGAIHFHDDDLVDANWQPDFELEVPAGLRSGVYAARLSAQEAEFYVPFFVRPPRGTSRAKIAYLAATATYLAYINNRGRFASLATELYHGRLTIMDAVDGLLLEYPEVGLSTYDRHSDGSGVAYASRLRPATNVKPTGRHWNFNLDLFIVDWLEHLGVDYDVITEEDLHYEGIDLLRPYAVVLTGSHPEYDSLAMLDALDGYLRQGGRLMYMGGNGFYWRIAHHPTRRGVIEVRRAEGGVRAWDALPGEAYHSFTGEYGGLWRRQGRAPQKLAGVGFISQGFDKCSYYRRTPASRDPRVGFMFEGIEEEILGDFGVLQGGAAGLEIDSADPALGTPPHALVVARSENHSNTYELVAEEVRIPHGATDALQNTEIHADLVFFETPAGGAVFSTGSIAYAGSLSWNRFDNNIARLTSQRAAALRRSCAVRAGHRSRRQGRQLSRRRARRAPRQAARRPTTRTCENFWATGGQLPRALKPIFTSGGAKGARAPHQRSSPEHLPKVGGNGSTQRKADPAGHPADRDPGRGGDVRGGRLRLVQRQQPGSDRAASNRSTASARRSRARSIRSGARPRTTAGGTIPPSTWRSASTRSGPTSTSGPMSTISTASS